MWKHQLKTKCQSQCNKNAEDLKEKLQNKRNFNGMEQQVIHLANAV